MTTLLDKWGMRVHDHYLRTGVGFEVEDATRSFSVPPGDMAPLELLRRYANAGWFRAQPIDHTPGMPAKRWRFYAVKPEHDVRPSGEPFEKIGSIGRVRSVFELGAAL